MQGLTARVGAEVDAGEVKIGRLEGKPCARWKQRAPASDSEAERESATLKRYA